MPGQRAAHQLTCCRRCRDSATSCPRPLRGEGECRDHLTEDGIRREPAVHRNRRRRRHSSSRMVHLHILQRHIRHHRRHQSIGLEGERDHLGYRSWWVVHRRRIRLPLLVERDDRGDQLRLVGVGASCRRGCLEYPLRLWYVDYKLWVSMSRWMVVSRENQSPLVVFI